MCPSIWFTAINGLPAAKLSDFAYVSPTSKEPTRPGPAVAAIAARSAIRVPDCCKASRVTGTIARRCSREASSGTTPPYLPCVESCDATIEERMAGRPWACSTTAAAVSSQEDSMPRMRTIFTLARLSHLLLDEPHHRGGRGPDAAPGGEVQQARSRPGAALRRRLQVEEQSPHRVAGFQGPDAVADAGQNDRQVIVQVVRRGRCHGTDAIVS